MKAATLLLCLFTVAPTALGYSVDGYNIVEMQWEVEVTPGGPMVILNGTIEQVHDQLVELNPNWDSEYLTEVVDDFEKPQDGKEVEKRTDFFGAKTICGRNGWRAAKGATIREGIGYLRGVNGKPSMGPGPGNCGRVSCSYDSGIFWCNDSGSTKTLSSYGSIADGAQHVLNECGNRPAGSSLVLVVGQVFHKTDWNVIVRETGC